METQHTLGGWLADFHNEQRDGGRFIVYVRGGNQLVPIAAVPTGVEGYGREEGRANARLIAAAPDMLAALERGIEAAQAVIGAWERGDLAGAVNWLEGWAQGDAPAAIAKAKGAGQ